MGNCLSNDGVIGDVGTAAAAPPKVARTPPIGREDGDAPSGERSPGTLSTHSSGQDCAVFLSAQSGVSAAKLFVAPGQQQQHGLGSDEPMAHFQQPRRPGSQQQSQQRMWRALDHAAHQLVRSVSDSFANLTSDPEAGGGVCTVLPGVALPAGGPPLSGIARHASADSCCLEAFAAYVPAHGVGLPTRAATLCLHLFQVSAVAVVQEPSGPKQQHAPACSILAHAGATLSHVELTAAGAAALCALSAHSRALNTSGSSGSALVAQQPQGLPTLALAAAVPLTTSCGGARNGALCLFDARPGRGPLLPAETELLCCIADLVARDVASELDTLESGSLFDPAATANTTAAATNSAAAGWAVVPRQRAAAAARAGCVGSCAGLAFIDASALGLPVLLEDALWGKFLTVAPRGGCGAAAPAAARGLASLLSLGAEEAGAAAAAAAAGRAFELSACVSHQLGGSMNLKVTCVPAVAGLAGAPLADSSSSSTFNNNHNAGAPGNGVGPCASLASVYVAAVDFLESSDPHMWLPGGGMRRFRLLPSTDAACA